MTIADSRLEIANGFGRVLGTGNQPSVSMLKVRISAIRLGKIAYKALCKSFDIRRDDLHRKVMEI